MYGLLLDTGDGCPSTAHGTWVFSEATNDTYLVSTLPLLQ